MYVRAQRAPHGHHTRTHIYTPPRPTTPCSLRLACVRLCARSYMCATDGAAGVGAQVAETRKRNLAELEPVRAAASTRIRHCLSLLLPMAPSPPCFLVSPRQPRKRV
jgi:hypothetical protein